MQSLLTGSFKNDFTANFPGDHSGNNQTRQTPGLLYCITTPTPVREPKLLAWSDELGAELGIAKPQSPEETAILGGNRVTPAMQPYAACYGGHQFGHWAGQLGDGRAITLGEWIMPDGSTQELQLKGAGPTPYSRRADGRAVLRSSVREYLMSEAMHYLGVPTTRALSLVATGDQVVRDMFYTGNAAPEPGAIVMRVAPSFLRFGNFELPAVRKETENLQRLVDWTIDRFYPHLTAAEDRIVTFYREVVQRTAHLMAQWMRVGFVHGVMNTDNMSILGLTIDYGPYSFVDDYDPLFTPNTTDLPERRYAFGRQPAIGKWNLACLAGALSALLPDTKPLADALQEYDADYEREYAAMMAGKLGLDAVSKGDVALFNRFDNMLAVLKPDMTLFYQHLIDLPAEAIDEAAVVEHFKDSFYTAPERKGATTLLYTISAYQKRLRENELSPEASKERMRHSNPCFVLRNYLLHQAIQKLEAGDAGMFNELTEAIKDPYSTRFDEFVGKRPDWAKQQAGCSMLSCSS